MKFLQLVVVVTYVLMFNSLTSHAFEPRRHDIVGSRRLQNDKFSVTMSTLSSSTTTALSATVRFKNFEQVLETFRDEPVVIYFGTANCGPCRLMKKEMTTFKEMVGKDLKVFSIDTETWPEVGSRFKVTRIPTLVLFREGEIQLRLEGLNAAATMVELVRSLL